MANLNPVVLPSGQSDTMFYKKSHFPQTWSLSSEAKKATVLTGNFILWNAN